MAKISADVIAWGGGVKDMTQAAEDLANEEEKASL